MYFRSRLYILLVPHQRGSLLALVFLQVEFCSRSRTDLFSDALGCGQVWAAFPLDVICSELRLSPSPVELVELDFLLPWRTVLAPSPIELVKLAFGNPASGSLAFFCPVEAWLPTASVELGFLLLSWSLAFS